MKKLFIMGLAAMGLALTACNSDETVEMAKGKAIGFSSFVDKSTRATDFTLANLGSIEVYGWRGDHQIFDKQEVTINAESGEGTYSPIQYWEAKNTYNFEAIAPKNGDKGVTFAANVNGGTITFVNDAKTDLLYSKATQVTTAENLTATPGKVNFTFQHQLARVKFTFKNTFPANAAAKISVKDVKITNAYKNGTLATPAAANAKWNATDNTLNVAFASTDVKDLAAGGNSAATEHHYLIPTGNENEYTVTFSVVLDQNGAKTTYNHTVKFTTTQEQGKSYNYVAEINEKNINPNPNEQLFPIEFTANVDDWGTWSNDVTIMKPAARN